MFFSVESRSLATSIACMTLGVCFTANADEAPEEVVVVANRAPVSLDKVGNSVSVLNEATIKESQASLVSDLLVTTPGVAQTRNGGPGSPTAIRIRGAETSQTLVLIDGVQMNDPSSVDGAFDFGNLLVGDISRIEILRGSQSTLYGSQAIGGIINIITTEPVGELQADMHGELGSYKTRDAGASLGGQFDQASFRMAGTAYHSDGVSSFARGTETDPFKNASFSGRFGYAFTPEIKLDLRAFYSDSTDHYDGFPPPFFSFADEGDSSTTRQFIGYAGLDFDLFDARLKNRIAFQSTDTDRETFLETPVSVTKNGTFDGKNQRYEYQGTWLITDGYQTVFGFQREESKMTSDSDPLHADVSENSYYAQLQAEVIKGLTLTAGERRDDHDTFGTHDTGQLAAAWVLPSDTVLRASWGQGFKAPTLYQLFSQYFNHDLRPEESHGWDAGVEQHFLDRRVMVSATYFSRDTKNQIDFLDCPPPLPGSVCAQPGHSTFGFYSNVDKTQSRGYELQAELNLTDDLAITGNYTHMKATDESDGPEHGLRLIRRPDVLANASVSYRWPVHLTTTVAARYTGPSFDNDFDTFPASRVVLGGFTLVDFRAAWALNDHVSITGRVENAFDKKYQTVLDFGTLGRAGFVGIDVKL
jgi:vitamin B12 transporter